MRWLKRLSLTCSLWRFFSACLRGGRCGPASRRWMPKWQWLACLHPPDSTQGSAILADDKHLGLGVPGTWFSGGVEKPLI